MEIISHQENNSQCICRDLFLVQQKGASSVRAALEVGGCVNKCPHCYAVPMKMISLIDAGFYLDGISKAGYQELYIPGGEPMLHPDIISICHLAQQKGLRTILVTNGYKLNDESMAFRILSVTDQIEISLRSIYSRVHDNVVQGRGWVEDESETKPLIGGFNDSVEALSILSRVKREQCKNAALVINHDLYRSDVDVDGRGMVYQMIKALADQGIQLDGINLQLIRMTGRALNNESVINQIQIKPDGLVQALIDLEIIKNDFNVEGYVIDDPVSVGIIPSFDVVPEHLRKYITPEIVPAISPDGKVRFNVVGD
jgi:hypothetical protein